MVELFEHIIMEHYDNMNIIKMKRRLDFTFQTFSCLWFTGSANHC
jgi:hypothetical protein